MSSLKQVELIIFSTVLLSTTAENPKRGIFNVITIPSQSSARKMLSLQPMGAKYQSFPHSAPLQALPWSVKLCTVCYLCLMFLVSRYFITRLIGQTQNNRSSNNFWNKVQPEGRSLCSQWVESRKLSRDESHTGLSLLASFGLVSLSDPLLSLLVQIWIGTDD